MKTETPAHLPVILRAEEAAGGILKKDAPPNAWNLLFTRACGSLSWEINKERNGLPSYFRAEAARLAAVCLSALRCLVRDYWEFPDADGRAALPDPITETVEDVAALLDHGEFAAPESAEDALAELCVTWAEFLREAATLQAYCNGTAGDGGIELEGFAGPPPDDPGEDGAPEAWRGEPDVVRRGPDTVLMFEHCANAATQAADFCGRAEAGLFLFH